MGFRHWITLLKISTCVVFMIFLFAFNMETGQTAGELFEMKLASNGKCLYPTGKDNGSLVNLTNCGSTVNTLWITIKTDNRSHRLIKHSNTGRCLDVKDWSTSSGGRIQIWDCHSGANQRWKERSWRGGKSIESVHSNKCMDYSTSKKAIQQYDCHFGGNQLWQDVKW